MPYLADILDPEPADVSDMVEELPVLTRSTMKVQDFALPGSEAEHKEVACLTSAPIADAAAELSENMDGVEYTSRPPSPPTRAPTPGLRIPPCPLRLQPFVPPPNFGAIEDHKIFRSAFPQDRNLDFLDCLEINTMLTFVGTEPSDEYWTFVHEGNIQRLQIDIAPNKDGNVKTTNESLCEALLVVLDTSNYPLYIHCNQGRHRTGCVIACLRKIQKWPLEDVLAEYSAYAYPKARTGDIDLITNFDPDCLLEHVKVNGDLQTHSKLSPVGSHIKTVDDLVEALASELTMSSTTSERSVESKADSGVGGIELLPKKEEPPFFTSLSLHRLSENVDALISEAEDVMSP